MRKNSNSKIWVNRIIYPVYNLGPGKRLSIWVQGCSIRCKNCLNKSLWDLNAGKLLNISSLVELILKLTKGYDGITLSGGEPFDQYYSLIEFLRKIKKYSKLNVLVYTGYYLYELLNKYPDLSFIRYIDYIIDGRYIETQNIGENIKGSKNQTIYNFNNGYIRKLNKLENSNKITISSSNNNIFFTGIPSKGELNYIERFFKNNGIELIFK